MGKVKITMCENCIYLTQDIGDMTDYQKAKAIRNFINNETIILENCADMRIRTILADNGINVYDTTESAYTTCLCALESKGKHIEITDIYENKELDGCVIVGNSKNGFVVVLENEKVLQAGVEIYERGI